MSAISSILLALLQLASILFGRSLVSTFVSKVRMAWNELKDEEFVAMCDAQYNSMLEDWEKYKSDREE